MEIISISSIIAGILAIGLSIFTHIKYSSCKYQTNIVVPENKV